MTFKPFTKKTVDRFSTYAGAESFATIFQILSKHTTVQNDYRFLWFNAPAVKKHFEI